MMTNTGRANSLRIVARAFRALGLVALLVLSVAAVFGQSNRGRGQSDSAARDAGQPSGQLGSRAEQAATPIAVSSADYRIAPGDELEIRIEDAPELSRRCTVDADGDITLNYLNRISVEQKTPQDLEKLIADSLRGRYLKDPSVAVTVTQFNSR